MIGAVVAYVVARPFIRKAAAERRRLAAQQRRTRHAAQAARQHARAVPKPTFTAEEREYLRQHTVSPYRTDK
ncbi:MAG: hypothetical protein ACRDPD_30095 [Streptosporangiaceae bacterium]